MQREIEVLEQQIRSKKELLQNKHKLVEAHCTEFEELSLEREQPKTSQAALERVWPRPTWSGPTVQRRIPLRAAEHAYVECMTRTLVGGPLP